MPVLKFLIFVGLCSVCALPGLAQTCCSGGVPLSGNLGLPPTKSKTLQVGLTYDLNTLRTFKTGTETINDDSRNRQTHSLLVQIGYAFNDRLAMEVLGSAVQQNRTIRQEVLNRESFTRTQGLGDAVVLLKYQLWQNNTEHTQLLGGAGIKLPTGRADLTDERGLTIVADLQPGSGAFDGIGWLQLIHSTEQRPTASWIAQVAYSQKGKNKRYLGSSTYQFGNEIQIITTYTDRIILGSALLDPAMSLRYRWQSFDRFNDGQVPSSGGSWVFANPALSWWLSPSFSINASAQLPIFARVVGSQVTPTHRITMGVFLNLNQ